MKKHKVFCIGFHKTGPSSIDVALQKLGFKVKGFFGTEDPDIAENALPQALEFAKYYDAFQDNPWPILYKELDNAFPGSKFILLLRQPDSWLKSQLKHFGDRDNAMRTWIYGVGSPEGNEDIYLARYMAHNDEVRDYFKDRPQDLLIMDLSKGDGWEILCPFLDEKIPNSPFPHANDAKKREKRKTSKNLKNTFRRLLGLSN